MIHDSKAYSVAYDAHEAAWRDLDVARIKYRSGLIGCAEFILVLRQYHAATVTYDKTFAVAQDGGYSGGKA